MSIVQIAGQFLKTNAPAILTGLGLAGVATTAVLGVRAGIKAEYILAEERIDRSYSGNPNFGEQITPKEALALTWRLFVPTGIAVVGTAACFLGAQTINVRRQAALLGLYTLSESSLQEFKDAATQVLEPKQRKAVEDSVAENKVRNNPPAKEFIVADPEGQLFLETMSGRYFNSTVEKLRQAAVDANEEILKNDYVLLNDWYERIGLDKTSLGDEMGWNHQTNVQVDFDAVLFQNADGTTKPIMTLRYYRNPIPQPYGVWS